MGKFKILVSVSPTGWLLDTAAAFWTAQRWATRQAAGNAASFNLQQTRLLHVDHQQLDVEKPTRMHATSLSNVRRCILLKEKQLKTWSNTYSRRSYLHASHASIKLEYELLVSTTLGQTASFHSLKELLWASCATDCSTGALSCISIWLHKLRNPDVIWLGFVSFPAFVACYFQRLLFSLHFCMG